jgi:very-short-patch-repair endonuclease
MHDIIDFLKIDNFFNENILTIRDYYQAKNEIFNDDFVQYIIKNAYLKNVLFELPTKESLQEFSKRLYNSLQLKIKYAKRKLKVIKYIKKYPVKIGQYHGISGTYEHFCFNEIEKILGIKIQRHVIINQKIVDGYLKKIKLCIEFNEPHHYLKNGSLNPYDIKRMEYILSIYPTHTFHIIKQDDFFQNFQNVIENFKNVIESKKSELLMKVG